MNIELSVEEINTVLTIIGDLPNKMGLYPLAMNIKQQAEAQLPQPPEMPDEE